MPLSIWWIAWAFLLLNWKDDILCAVASTSSRHHRPCPKIDFPSRRNGWIIDDPDWLDVALLEQELKRIGDNSHSLFATHCGRVVFQRNANNTQYPIYSIGKTFVTTWVGILLHLGEFSSLDDEVLFSNNSILAMQEFNLSSTWHWRDGVIGGPLRSLRSLLTMTSGFGLERHAHVAAYSNNAMEFLYVTIQRRLGIGDGDSDLVLVRRLFHWYLGGGHQDDLDLRGQITGYGGGGLRISARDLARLGVLYLGRGMGRNACCIQRAFDAAYGENVSWAQVPANTPVTNTLANQTSWNVLELSKALPYRKNGHTGRMEGFVGYSYGLWVLEDGVSFAMSGKKGNYVIVDWSTGLVIVILNHRDAHPPANQYLSAFRRAIRTKMAHTLSEQTDAA